MEFLRDTRVGCFVMTSRPGEEGEGSETEEEEGCHPQTPIALLDAWTLGIKPGALCTVFGQTNASFSGVARAAARAAG